jgi:hypothetical protein
LDPIKSKRGYAYASVVTNIGEKLLRVSQKIVFGFTAPLASLNMQNPFFVG